VSVICVDSEMNRVINCLYEPFKTHCDAEPAVVMLIFMQKQFGRFGCTFG